MGTTERSEALGACLGIGLSLKMFDSLETAALHRYPALNLFQGFGVKAQSLEGQIIKTAMINAIREELPMLPLHDACVTYSTHSGLAEEILYNAWIEHLGEGAARPRLAVK